MIPLDHPARLSSTARPRPALSYLNVVTHVHREPSLFICSNGRAPHFVLRISSTKQPGDMLAAMNEIRTTWPLSTTLDRTFNLSCLGPALDRHTVPLPLFTGEPSGSPILLRVGVRDRFGVANTPARAHRCVHPSLVVPYLSPKVSRRSTRARRLRLENLSYSP